MLKCAKCGQEMVEGTIVCPSCGTPVSGGVLKQLPQIGFGKPSNYVSVNTLLFQEERAVRNIGILSCSTSLSDLFLV